MNMFQCQFNIFQYFAWFLLPLLNDAVSNNTSPSFGCQQGWYRHGNSCYYFSTVSVFWAYGGAWKPATSKCIDKDADLAIVDSQEELQFLTSVAHALKLNEVFLGSRDTIKISWSWFQGPAVNLSLWGPRVAPKEKCVGLLRKSHWCGWWWVDLPCNSRTRYGYICEGSTNYCSGGNLTFGNTCYTLNLDSKKTWSQAQTSCSQVGAKLAVVDTEEKRVFLSKELDKIKWAGNPTTLYIGLTRDMSEWSWINGQAVNKSLFQAGSTIERKDEAQCLAIDASKSVSTGLIVTSCRYKHGYWYYTHDYVCEKNEVNIAEGSDLEYSIVENDTQVRYIVDGILNTCLRFIVKRSTWLKIQLEKETYIYKVKINVSPSKNYTNKTFEVQVKASLPYSRNKTCLFSGIRFEEIFYECKPVIQSSAVIIKSNQVGSTLSICEIQVYGAGSSTDIQGVLRNVWIYDIDVKSLREYWKTKLQRELPYNMRVMKNLQMSYELTREHALLQLSGYLKVFHNGGYNFLITCKAQCEVTLGVAVEQVFQDDSPESLLLDLKYRTTRIDWKRHYKKHPTSIKLSVCRLYHVNTYVKDNYVTVGLKYPDGKLSVPVPNEHLYWTQPGERSFRFQLMSETNFVEVGNEFVLLASYRYCCHGIQCPNCSLNLHLHVFNSSSSVHPSIGMDCKEHSWSTVIKTTVQPGKHSIEISYHFLQDKDLPTIRRTVGYVSVNETTLLRCAFTDKSVCGWKTNSTTVVATDNPLSVVFLESLPLLWNDIYQAIGACLSFSYKLHSPRKGEELNVYLSIKGKLVLLWRLIGFHGDGWRRALVSWRPQDDSKLVFKIIGKAAISDVLVTTSTCKTKPPYAKPGFTCSEEEFQCKNYQCIKKTFVCDGDNTCLDGSDEENCVCRSTGFNCPSGSCLATDKLCNGRGDCDERSDEKTCERRNNMRKFQCVDGAFVPWSVTCREGSYCKDGSHSPDICSQSRCPLNNLACNETNKENALKDSKCNKAFPTHCSLDDGLCGLTSDTKEALRWKRRNGPTPTPNTGPSFDHTTLSELGYYLYIEASNETKGTKARLNSRWFLANQPVCFRFWYHMFGVDIGLLNIVQVTNASSSMKWSQNGDRGNRWLFAQVTLLAGEPYKFVIEGVIGDGVYGDIAIDDLGVTEGSCATILEQSSPNCDFQSDVCGWHGDKEWSLSKLMNVQGVTAPDTGGFVYLLRQKSYTFTHRISSPPLRLLDNWKCLMFSYYIGATATYFTHELTVFLQNKNGSSSKLWGTPHVTNKWIYVQVPFSAGVHGEQVTFEGTLSHSAVLAFDEVSFSKTSCHPIPYHTDACSVLTFEREKKCCWFPFIHEQTIYYECDTTDPKDPQPWCLATPKYYRNFYFCDGYCPWRVMDGRCCMFPFLYNGKEYSSCITHNDTRPWCMTNLDGGWGYCQGECATTEELCRWKSQQIDTTMNWSVVSALDVYREITNISKTLPNDGQESRQTKQSQVHLPLSQFGNITINSAISDQIDAVTLCFWMTSQTGGLRVLYEILDECGMKVAMGIHMDTNVMISILGHNWTTLFSVNDGAWHHVCLTWRSAGGTLKAYIDGRVSLREKHDESDGLIIPEGGTFTASLMDTTGKNNPEVIGKISGVNIWSREMNEFELLAMSIGCVQDDGDLLSWNSILKETKNSHLKTEPAECVYSGADHFIFATNSSSVNPVLNSPWYNRSTFGHTQCLRFRYIVYGPGAQRLRVMHRYDPSRSFVPVLDVIINNQSWWQFAQTSVGTVNNYQLSIEASFNQSSGFIAISALYLLDGGCRKQPAQNQALKVNLTQKSGMITSPFHPGYYDVDTANIWVISAPPYHLIRLKILAFDLEYDVKCGKDYLELFDGRSSVASTRIGRFCGAVYPHVIESTTNYMTIRFHSDSSTVRTGFKLSYVWKNVKVKTNACALKGCSYDTKCYVTSGDESGKVVEESRGQNLEVLPFIPRQISVLLLGGNRITNLTKSHFDSLSSLEYIDLSGNLIFITKYLAFADLSSIKVIRLNGNFMRSFPKFASLPKLHTLDLGANLLSNVTRNCLIKLPSLRILSLRMNEIAELEDGSFNNMPALQYLYLDHNNIKKLTKDTFKGLKALQILNLQNNKLSEKDMTSDVFESLRNLRKLKLDNFILCCYAMRSISKDLQCESPGNEFSSCDDMMKNSAVSVCLWILGILASFGNLLVVVWRFKIRDENKVQSLLLTNLAVADFLMGIYLLILAIKDIEFKGEYYKHDVEWRSGMTCQFAGALSLLSSEASVLTLTVITADRLICVVFAFKIPRLSMKMTCILCSVIWTFCLIISFLPILGFEYFVDNQYGFGFYGRSTVCLPLQLSSQLAPGWEYSITFFIFLNLGAFVFILVSYCAIFWTIVRMSRSSATKHMRKESSKAARLFFIIFTDFCCWMPVIILGILSLTNSFSDPKGTVYVWIAVFVLPINSSINPILYTFSTDYVKRHLPSVSLFSSFSYQSYSRNRIGNEISLKDREHPENSTHSANLPKVDVTGHEKDLVEELSILEKWNIFQPTNQEGTIGFELAETKSKEKVLVKYFGEKNLEDWKREVDVQTVLQEYGSHDNVLSCKWMADSESSSFTKIDASVSSIPSKAWLICYTYSSSTTLKDFCETQGGPDVLYNVVLDVISGLEHLHGNGICHNFINKQSILIEDKTGIPSFKAVIGDFRNSFVLSNNLERDSCEQKLEDVKQLGELIDSLFEMCDENSTNEIRDFKTMLKSDKTSVEILSSWRQTLLRWDFSSSC